MPSKKPLSFEGVHQFLRTLFANDLHAKRVLSLAGATLGVIASASLAVAMIGQGLALARGRLTKHAIKQVDSLLSNRALVSTPCWSTAWPMWWASGPALRWRWTGPALTPTARRRSCCRWCAPRTGDAAGVADGGHRQAEGPAQNSYGYQVLVRLAEVLPADVRVRIVADRGFGDHKLHRVLTDELKFDFVICFRGNITVTAANSETRPAADWVGAGGRARVLRGATVTATGFPLGAVVCVQAKNMKQPWCLAASITAEPARALVSLYAKRWASRARSATLRTCASAWVWARCTSAPPISATACG